MNFGKLKSCIVHTCAKAAPQLEKLDPIKLNKVLWYSDAASFMETGESITGARYIRKSRGPVASCMASVVRDLCDNGVLTRGRCFNVDLGSWFDEYTVNDDSKVDKLSEKDVAYLDHSFKRVCMDHTTFAVSERTHGEIWELAADGEEIPLFTMFAERLGRITKEHVDAALAE